MANRWSGWAFALLLSACAAEPARTGTLDCDWFVSETNCWKTMIAPALRCLPPAGQQGIVAADEGTCSYPGGTTVTFTPSLAENSIPSEFSISDASGECLRYRSIGERRSRRNLAVTTQAGTYTQIDDGVKLTITCPDSSSYSAPIASLESCGAQTGLGPIFGDFLIPSASMSSGSGLRVEYELSPRPSNPSGLADSWLFKAFRCGDE